MNISMYHASIPVFQQILGSLDAILAKAEVHAETRKIEPQALLLARLYPDMFPLQRQVQIACDFAKGAGHRLAGLEVPVMTDDETSFQQLRQRIAKTLALLAALPNAAIEESAEREITTGSGERARQFKGRDYLLHYVLPHFYFHATTAYDILRHNGVEIGKRDFIGNI